MTERATCWSITINNPTEKDLTVQLPAGWKLTGQIEKGEEGTTHYQGMLTTNQVRFAAVKKVFERAHIEVAKNKRALEKYVHKTDTRLETVPDRQSDIPTLFDYQNTVALRWDPMEFEQFSKTFSDAEYDKIGIDEIALRYLDKLVAEDIRDGVRGIEFIAINPMWRSSWKKFWRAIIFRAININAQKVSEAQEPRIQTPPLAEEIPSNDTIEHESSTDT